MKISSKSIAYLIALTLSVSASAQQGAANPVTLNRIGDNLYEVLGGSGANGGAYIGEYGVLLGVGPVDDRHRQGHPRDRHPHAGVGEPDIHVRVVALDHGEGLGAVVAPDNEGLLLGGLVRRQPSSRS